jgi:hypothetical protein
MPLVTYANLVAPSLMDPSKTFAEQSLIRMQDKQLPMPPAPAAPESAAEETVLQDWINAGYPAGTCELLPPDAGVDTDGGSPYDTPEMCTSMMSWTRGDGQTMRPGEACIACHSSGGGPRFTIAGTLYPTAHEPDDCNGANGSTGAQVVITDAKGIDYALNPNSVGNFTSSAAISVPYHAKVVRGSNERVMVEAQTVGDCNTCHTTSGANAAPGRIMLP